MDITKLMFKLWKSNKLTFEEICSHTGVSLQEGMNILSDLQQKYPFITVENFNYLIGQDSTLARMKTLISKSQHILLVGSQGSGKTNLAKKLTKCHIYIDMTKLNGSKLKERIGTSHITDFEVPYDIIILDNAHNFDWKSYRTVNKFLTESIRPFILITSEISKIPSSVRTKVFAVNTERLNKNSVLEFARMKFPEIPDERALTIWNSCHNNMELFITNLIYNHLSERIIVEKLKVSQAVNLILKEKDRNYVFKALHNLREPWFWIIGWLRHNFPKIYRGQKLIYWLEVVSWLDIHKFKTSKEYIFSVMAYLIEPTTRKFWASFPDLIGSKKSGRNIKRSNKPTRKSKNTRESIKIDVKDNNREGEKRIDILDAFDL